ncbi:hypothetical protein [Mycobacterium sp. PSTR-4-N]|uniref:hypothetical protein n=1 Tax=Mycobacterium sp. PSTR-4-N TaxID=2917745 RepID=UPI001F1557F9|nr:hypothetical protein [Mycobacterium sp. PSTR-4-N]MCG7596319.1 hypothetical protein [Mycobacterium sp. PSTR-4-N]
MNVISYISGDTKITDYPKCSARPLARMVQNVNDQLAGRDDLLSPEDSVIVLELGWRTVGTADAPREVVWRWLADLLTDPEHGVVKHARPDGAAAIRVVAALCLREARGETVPAAEWNSARTAARKARAYAAAYAAAAAAADADAAAAADADAAAAADADAYAAADAAAAAAADADAYAAADAAAAAAAAAAADADADADADAAAAADADAAAKRAMVEFTRWAIEHWRTLASLDDPSDIDAATVDSALVRIGG